MDGYIRLDRTILNWEWYTDVNTFKLFLHILLKANKEPGQRKGVYVPRGSVAISYQELAEETGLSRQNVRTSLNRLKSSGELEVKNCGKFSRISVKNYDEYQYVDEFIETQKENEEHICDIEDNTESNTVIDTGQTRYYQSFSEFEKDDCNTMPNTLANTDFNTVRCGKKRNLQYTYYNRKYSGHQTVNEERKRRFYPPF